MKDYIKLWDNTDINLADWEYLLLLNPTVTTTDEQYRLVRYELDVRREELIDDLNITLTDDLLIIADLGLWDGRHHAIARHQGNLNQVFSRCCGDFQSLYIDQRGDLRCLDIHHDGTNKYLYRTWKPGVSNTRRENFVRRWLHTDYTDRQLITRYTDPVGHYIIDKFEGGKSA